jgi:hypothetical protein
MLARRFYLVSFAALSILLACGGARPPDTDGTYTQASHLFSGVSVGDQIEPRMGDREDWRKFRFVEDTEVDLLVVMAPLTTNPVSGRVEVFDDTFARVHGSPVQPGQGRYELGFQVKGGADYYVVIRSDSGTAPYQIRLEGKPVDPCSKCGADEICAAGHCVPRPPPPTDPCGGCDGGKACDTEIQRCVWPACVGKRCPRKRHCNAKGDCVRSGRVHKPRPRGCPPGHEMQAGRCVPVMDEPPSQGELVLVKARVVGVVDQGDGKSEIILDKGSAQGLSKNLPPGRLSGLNLPVRLVRIFAVRARAIVNVPPDEIRGKGRTVRFMVPKK